VVSCGPSCPGVIPCGSGTTFDSDSCSCVVSTGAGGAAADAGPSCANPVTCADSPICDGVLALEPETWCGTSPSDQPPSHWIAQCADGYTAIKVSGIDSGVIYYYRGGSLVAVFDVGIGGTSCNQGPATFAIPSCGPERPLCPVPDGGSDVSSEAGDADAAEVLVQE